MIVKRTIVGVKTLALAYWRVFKQPTVSDSIAEARTIVSERSRPEQAPKEEPPQ